MKKILLVMAALILAGCFSLYILDPQPGSDPSSIPKDQSSPEGNSKESYEPNVTDLLSNNDINVKATPENNWEPVWEDDFEKTTLDMEHWSKVDRMENYNNELQYYGLENVYTDKGYLYLEAKKESKNGKAYTSGMVQTKDKFALCYGKIEFRVKMPQGKGFFPAVWLLQQDGGDYYEIDIIENIGNEPNIVYSGNYFPDGKKLGKSFGQRTIDNPEEFHLYSIEWEPDKITWYVDGQPFLCSTEGIPKENMYIIITLAIGGDWPGPPDPATVFPQSMVMDYIKVYKRAASR